MRCVFLWILIPIGCCLMVRADSLQFRGNHGNGLADNERLPTRWSTTENLAWKVELPGRGPSSPIVVSDRVVITCSSGVHQDRFHVICLDAATGQQLWHRQFWATGRTLTHPDCSNATPTPASDGKLVFAFSSSNDLVCLDLEGNLRWYRGLAYDYPKAGNDIGMSSSLVVAGDVVVVQMDNQGDPFAAGIETSTGQTRWRFPRDPVPSWSSPTLLREADGTVAAVLFQSPNGLTAIEPGSGKLLWQYEAKCDGITSPVVTTDHIFLASQGITRLDVEKPAQLPFEAWNANPLAPRAISPVVSGDRIYSVNSAGVLICGDVADGSAVWRLRLEGKFWASPVLSGNHLYLVNDKGMAQVVDISNRGQVVFRYDFGERIQATPAAAGDALYFRSDRHMWKIGRK